MHTFLNLDLQGLSRLAMQLAALGTAGDCLCLNGDLGAGKSQFARFFIRQFISDLQRDVPSPSYGLVISYEDGRCPLHHYDFYRLGSIDDAIELNVEEQFAHGISVIEWGQNIPELLPNDRLEITLSQGKEDDLRHVELQGVGLWEGKLKRFLALQDFLEKADMGAAEWAFLTGDASSRSYVRLNVNGTKRVLMNAPPVSDGPVVKQGKTYSQLVHLAEDMRPFVAVGDYLYKRGVHVPKVHAHDLEQGFLLLDDLGNQQFGPAAQIATQQENITKQAVDLLVSLGQKPVEDPLFVEDGDPYHMAHYDREVLQFEADLTLDYYWPLHHKKEADRDVVHSYHACWEGLWGEVEKEQSYLVLRDYHSPNLLLLGARGQNGLGVIDFQDALLGHRAYDLVSLLQDARIDVAKPLEGELLVYYCDQMRKEDTGFDIDAFMSAYRILGAQRAAKLLGIFVRLCVRDKKPHYLAHLPRVWDYMHRNLAHHSLAELNSWFEENLPDATRDIGWLKRAMGLSGLERD